MTGEDRREPSSAARIGEWLAEPSLNRLTRGDTVVHLRPKAMDVLDLLARHAGQVVARETIIDTVWARKYLADSALASAISELRKALGDDAQRPDYIETIQKRGYRLIPPVVLQEQSASGQDPAPRRASRLFGERSRRALLAGAAVLATASVVDLLSHATIARQAAVVKVARFENIGPGALSGFAEGVSEEIGVRLAMAPGLVVMSDAVPDRTPAAAERSASYVVRGSVRWTGFEAPKVARITAQLIRIRDRATLWSTTYERTVDDGFALQTEVGADVAEQVEAALGGGGPRQAGGFSPDATR